MSLIFIPGNYNYIGVFLTFACNLKCSYCINNFEEKITRRNLLCGQDWVKGLNRIVSRDDLPVTLQGGEPSLHPDFFYIVNNIKPELNIDILTNLRFDIDLFMKEINPDRIKRESPYASIRVSYHPEQMDFDELSRKTLKMMEKGYSIGIWGVAHPRYESKILEAQGKCRELGIDFRTKEFLGDYGGKLYGNYRFNGACSKKFRKVVQCKTTEFIMDSQGDVYRCHADLYTGKGAIGNITDSHFEIDDKFRECINFGYCNPCDVKVKTNRFQQGGHTSVEVQFVD